MIGYYRQVINGTGPTSYSAATMRYYYGSIPYNRPNVRIIGLPNPYGGYDRATNSWPAGIGIVLKRTSATNYIDVRWHASFAGYMHNNVTGLTDPHHELEIVVNNAGAGEVVRASADRGTSFTQPALLLAWLDASNVVHAQIVSATTSTFGPYTPLLEATYQLTAGEITSLGAGVSGAAGITQIISLNVIAFGTERVNSGAVCQYVARRDDVPVAQAVMAVMGDVDTPPKLRLAGDLLNPLVTISTPDGKSSSLQFVDTFSQANPVTIDFDAGTIVDSTGADRFRGLQAGSSMRNLQPGSNIVSVQADNWTTGVQHVVAWWRNARK